MSQFCYVCLNGGDLLCCDNCPRAICVRHLVIPPNAIQPSSRFLCVACHLSAFKRPTPYMVNQTPLPSCMTHTAYHRGFTNAALPMSPSPLTNGFRSSTNPSNLPEIISCRQGHRSSPLPSSSFTFVFSPLIPSVFLLHCLLSTSSNSSPPGP